MELNKGQKEALRALLGGENVFLTGGAGTGKTFLLNHFLHLPQNKEKNILVCAPTGIAALQIGGATLHRTFKVPLKIIEPLIDLRQDSINEAVKDAEIIVIDEISMCRIDVFQYVVRKIIKAEKMSKKHKQIILVGDFFQLPPVVINTKKAGQRYSDKDVLIENYGDIAKNGFAFLSPCWTLLGIKTAILSEVIRQKDQEFSDSLNRIRVGDSNGLAWISQNCRKTKIPEAITLCSTNRENEKINNRHLNKLSGDLEEYETIINGEKLAPSEIPVQDTLRLKVGCRVMALINDTCSPFRYSNGSLGTVEKLEHHGEDGEECLTIKFDNGNIVEVPKYEWEVKRYVSRKDKSTGKKVFEQETVATIIQYPIKIAYSITIHKSQGQTYDEVTVQPRHCFAPGQLYVALSRAVSVKNLHVVGELSSEQLICSEEVQQFYEKKNFVTRTLLTAQKNMGSSEIKAELNSLPFYTRKAKEKSHKHCNQKSIIVETVKKEPVPTSIDVMFQKADSIKQKAFAQIVGILAQTTVTQSSCMHAYTLLSDSKKHIAKATLC